VRGTSETGTRLVSGPDGFELWTVYDRPRDFPHTFVARRFVITAGHISPTDDYIVCADVERIRTELIKRGYARLVRHPQDDPKIIEVWV
jgi:hypothetical protein